MKRPYEATLDLRNEKVLRSAGRFRTYERAARAVRRALERHHTVTTTNANYWRDVSRASSGFVTDLRRPTKRVGPYIEPPVNIVPSVGELGYW